MSGERWLIPSTWQWSSADGIADIIGGGTPSTSEERNFSSDGIPWITPADLTGYSDTYIGKGARDLSQSGYNASGAQLMPKGTILFSSRAPIGYCAISANEICTNQGFKSLVLKGDVVPEYIRYYLLSAKEYAESLASGTTFKELSGSRMAGLAVPVAPLAEQIRITKKVDALFARSRTARKELAHIPKLIERYRQAVLEAAFRGDLTADWRMSAPPGSQSESILQERADFYRAAKTSPNLSRDERSALLPIDSEMANDIAKRGSEISLPKTWRWSALGQVFGVYVGATPSRGNSDYWGGNVNWVSSGEVAFCSISQTRESITALGLKSTSTRIHPIGTILLGMIGEGKTRGQCAILNIPACNNQNCAAIRVSEADYSPDYIYWYFVNQYQKTRNIGAGNNQPALNKEKVQRILFPLAPREEAVEISRRIKALLDPMSVIEKHVEQCLKLGRKLEKEVLDKAFAGKIVPQDPNDEPASALLERIKAARVAAPRARRGRRPAVA